MTETIFLAPSASQDDGRMSWMFTDASENTMMEANLDEMYATNEPSLGVDEWPMH